MPDPAGADSTTQATLPMDLSSAYKRQIGEIGNCEGNLEVKQENTRFFWAIENWNGYSWEEIPEYLFVALNRFQDEKERRVKVLANAN